MEKFRGQHLSTVDFVLLPYLDQQDLRMSEEVKGLRFLYTFWGGVVARLLSFLSKEEGGWGGIPHEKDPHVGTPEDHGIGIPTV